MSEIWKTIEEAPNYEVSNMGRVRNKKTGYIKKPAKHRCGYLKYSLKYKGIMKRYYSHRLVAQAFIPNPDNLPQVNHKDEDKTNNCVSNLEWCTAQYNNHYSRIAERVQPIGAESIKRPLIQLTKDGKYVAEYESGVEASIKTGIHKSSICMCCKGKHKSAGGYIFKYK